MIAVMHGDLLKQDDVDAIVNTVNCVGIMGKGIALQFKNKWPSNFTAYAAACKAGSVRLGRMFIHDLGGLLKPHYIVNFPTKEHWRGASKIEFIGTGLVDLVAQVRRLHIRSIAIPPLGCGNGGLKWSDVRPLIVNAFEDLPNVEVRLFEPKGAPDPKSMEVRTKRPRMTPGRAAIVQVLDTYRGLNYGLSKIEVQKLAYFLQEAGEPLDLRFEKHDFGPYSDRLRHVLNTMEGHYIRGVGDGVVEAEIEPTEEASKEAEAFIAQQGRQEVAERVSRVGRLIDGYQSPYGMELLASVHWVAAHERSINTVDRAVAAIQDWNERKRVLLKPVHVASAWHRLDTEGWLAGNRHPVDKQTVSPL